MENDFQVISRNTDGEERTVHFEGTVEQVIAWLTDPVIQESSDDNLVYEVYTTKTFSYFSITEFLALFGNLLDKLKAENPEPIIKIFPDELQTMVSKYFVMNPETDDLLLTGYRLRPGMEVLIEDHKLRGDVNGYEDEAVMHRLLQYNRWCVIEDLRFNKEFVNFIGKYEDGTKRSFTLELTHSWFVKKESLNKNEQALAEDLDFLKVTLNEVGRFGMYLESHDAQVKGRTPEEVQDILNAEVLGKAKSIQNYYSS